MNLFGDRRHSCSAALVALGALGATLLLPTGCVPAPTPPLMPVGAATRSLDRIADADSLAAYLAESGMKLGAPEELAYDWFAVPGRTYALNADASSALVLHTYPSASAATKAVDGVSSDASTVVRDDGQRIRVQWPDAPHVYLSGPMVVVYVGGDGTIMQLLTLALGPQVAGPMPPAGVGVH